MNLYAYVNGDPINATDPWGLITATVGGGLGGGGHFYGAGVHVHQQVQCGSGGCYSITTACGRIGPGMYIGGGTEGGGVSIGGGPTGVSVGGTIRSPVSAGLGFSVGVDVCYIKSCPL